MKKYCFDTSGLSNPLESMPEDIHTSLWKQIIAFIESGHVAATPEIYEEMCSLTGNVGECIRNGKKLIVMELESDEWDWESYVTHSARMTKEHEQWISEYNGGSPKTVCLNDITIIALAKALGLPVVSMEARVGKDAVRRRKIPDICGYESVAHMTFNDFLRAEGITL